MGSGWYNCQSTGHWSFDKAPWRDHPKFICDLEVDGEPFAASDETWLTAPSPVTYDALRGGKIMMSALKFQISLKSALI